MTSLVERRTSCRRADGQAYEQFVDVGNRAIDDAAKVDVQGAHIIWVFFV